MNALEKNLWDRIAAFEFDEAGTTFTFARRLARENGWSVAYTRRVIDEYKRFIFLCCVSNQGVTPSDPVDQAWHLHLTFTKSYWLDFCRDTLGQEIHHNPTKGGSKERAKFNGYYSEVQGLYFQKFATNPPLDIWHNNQKRFSEINFQRVSLDNYWLISKPSRQLKIRLSVAAMAVLALGFVQASGVAVFLSAIFVFIIGGILYAAINSGNNKDKAKNDGDGGSSGCGTTIGSDSDSHHGDSDGGSDSGGDSGCSGCGGCGGGD